MTAPRARRADSQAGVTLIEVLIAVSLLSVLAVSMLLAIRAAIGALERANQRIISNRRVTGAQRVLEDEIAGFIPVSALCIPGGDAPRMKMPFFQGEPQSMRFVSAYSLQEAWRGAPHILEFQIVPGEQGQGVRLLVNEILYTGPLGAGQLCYGVGPDPELGIPVPRFRPIETSPRSFVLADKLAFCRFLYLELKPPPALQQWHPRWVRGRWPAAIRVEMAPLGDDLTRLRPLTVTAPIRVTRSPDINYVD
jgi:prepilin-type N-terminal cleavage/methylation domain-containing protein